MFCIYHCPPLPRLQVLGSPSDADLHCITSDKARRYVRSLPQCTRTEFHTLWPAANAKVCSDRLFMRRSIYTNTGHS